MQCQGGNHVFQYVGNCQCGYFRQGIALKSEFWKSCVLSLLRAGYGDAKEVKEIADKLEEASIIRLKPEGEK